MDEVLERIATATPDVVRRLAVKFGLENPGVKEQELEDYVRAKLEELTEVNERLDALEDMDKVFREIIDATREAVTAGRFADADSDLAKAEALRRARNTVPELRESSDIRVIRAQTALLNDDPHAAASHFSTAVEYLTAVDADEGALLRQLAGYRLLEHGERRGGAGMELAVDFFAQEVDYRDPKISPVDWALAKSNLCVAQQSYGERLSGEESVDVLRNALEACRAGLDVLSRDENPREWAGVSSSLGNARIALAS